MQEEIISDSCLNTMNSSDKVSLHSPISAAIEIESGNDKMVSEKVMMQDNIEPLPPTNDDRHYCKKRIAQDGCDVPGNKSDDQVQQMWDTNSEKSDVEDGVRIIANDLVLAVLDNALTLVWQKKLEARHSWHISDGSFVKDDIKAAR